MDGKRAEEGGKIISRPTVGAINQEVVRVNESGVDRERREYEDHGRKEGIFWTSGGDEGRRTELTERTRFWGVRVRGRVRRRRMDEVVVGRTKGTSDVVRRRSPWAPPAPFSVLFFLFERLSPFLVPPPPGPPARHVCSQTFFAAFHGRVAFLQTVVSPHIRLCMPGAS